MSPSTPGPPPGTLALIFQEILTAGSRLRWRRQEPRDTAVFRRHCRQAVDTGTEDSRDAGYSPEDIKLAAYAVIAFIDETVLNTADSRFADWLKLPIEREMYGAARGGEQFYRHLRAILARPNTSVTADLCEVYLLCLLLGFTGTLPSASAERAAFVRQSAAKLAAIRGTLNELSPAWRVPSPGRPVLVTPAPRALAPADETTAPVDFLIDEAARRLALTNGARLAELPALLVLGEAGSVKTSTVLHCGVRKEPLAGEVHRDGNVTPTALANLWLARGSVIVEAGSEMRAGGPLWQRLVERLRPQAAVGRAALVCMDAERLIRPGALTNAAGALRERLEEYALASGIRVPVYVLFTRMDRLSGFPEFVRRLTHEEASRAVGATLAAAPSGADEAWHGTRVKQACDAIYWALAAARWEIMARETDPACAAAAYEFPRELLKLKPLVADLLAHLLPRQTRAGPFLRGFYFAGARPIVIDDQGRETGERAAAPPERFLATGMFGGPPEAPKPVSSPSFAAVQTLPVSRKKIPQWLFLGHLFHEVLLADYLG